MRLGELPGDDAMSSARSLYSPTIAVFDRQFDTSRPERFLKEAVGSQRKKKLVDGFTGRNMVQAFAKYVKYFSPFQL